MSEYHLSVEDLQRHLEEQIGFLTHSTDAFDSGFEGEAKRLAVTLRLLLHDTNRSRSLLDQLGMKGAAFVDTAAPSTAGNLMSTHTLIGIHVGAGAPRYVPLLDYQQGVVRVGFDRWWSAVVFIDRDGRQLSRKDVVLTAADKDGGAHVDPKLTAAYAAISRGNSLGWIGQPAEGAYLPLKNPERAAIRQIAHEVLKTLVAGYERSLSVTEGSVASNISVVEVPDAFPIIGTELAPVSARPPEISAGKLRFFPEAGEFFFRNDQAGDTIPGEEYLIEVDIDKITTGSVRAVVGAHVTHAIASPGKHRVRLRAGPEQSLGVFGAFTDAVLDRISVRQIL